jgi:hypothetical protein
MTLLLGGLTFELVAAAELARRRTVFDDRRKADPLAPVIVAEGDSWFCYPRDSILVPDDAPVDCVTVLQRSRPVLCVGRPGDTLGSMADFASSVSSDVDTFGAEVLMLSGGGNDLLGGGRLSQVLRPGNHPPSKALTPAFFDLLETAAWNIARIVHEVRRANPAVKIMIHGYDYGEPTGKGPWLKAPMDVLGIPVHRHRPIVRSIVNAVASRYQTEMDRLDHALAGGRGEIVFVDLRNAVKPTEWYDELHPDDAGFRAVAAKLDRQLKRFLPLVA